MIKKVVYATLCILLCAITLIFAMEQQEQPTPMEIVRALIEIQKVPAQQELELPEAAVILDGIEYLDTSKDEPILMTPFSELINPKAKYGVPFMLAVVSLYVPSESCCMGSTVVRHAYYEAVGFNAALFGNIEYNAQTRNLHYYKNRLNMTPDKMRDPFSKQFIANIQYFIINPKAKTATFLARDFDFFVNSPAQQFLVSLFDLHFKMYKELNAQETNPEHSLHELYLLLVEFGDLSQQQHKYQEAEHYYKQAEDQNVDLRVKYLASMYLGWLYLRNDYWHEQKAEHYLKQAANQNIDLITKAKASNNLGSFYYDEEKLQEAEHYLKQAADQNDELGVKQLASYYLGELYKEQNKLQEAEHYLKQAADQNDELGVKQEASYHLGQLYKGQNKLQEAKHYYKQAADENLYGEDINFDIQQYAEITLEEIRETLSQKATESTSKRSKVDVDQ